jgi:radical SAM protein with 4Fe4S-binding SPASM domain
VSHRRLDVVNNKPFPAYVVWELTLQCDHACTHCGSRAGSARDSELSTDEALALVDTLAALGTREVVLIGGEAYLHDGFLRIVEALNAANIVAALTTGGRGVTAALAADMARAGLQHASVSIDGSRNTHDRMRGAWGSFDAAMGALGHMRDAGIRVGSNMNLNRLNQGDVEVVYDLLREQGVDAWQLQLTAPLGRAADRADLILQPWDLLTLVPRIAALKERTIIDGVKLMPGNNLGYFGPEEALLRSFDAGGRDHWRGCQAGRFVMGIESNGAVKGCPSLQSAHYVGGNVRDTPLDALWHDNARVGFSRSRDVGDLWGFCATCDFSDVCMGGCTFTAHAILGRPGNNPYCHYRARALAKRGIRERLVPDEPAQGLPFDNGTFRIVEEAIDAPDPQAAVPPDGLVRITRRAERRR